MKVSLLPQQLAADGTEEIVIVAGPADARISKRMPAGLLADASTKPTPDELKAAILAALVQGSNITFVQNADGTVGVAVSDSADLPGTPKAPTAAPGTNTRQIATTAFVKAAADALTALINGKQSKLIQGANIDLHDNGDGTFTIASTGGGGAGGLTDGVYGDVTVSNGGTRLTVTNVTNGTVTVPDEAYGAAWQTKLSVPTKNAVYNQIEAVKSAKVNVSAVGVANGVASLDATGKVPAGQLPSYVDDVLEFSNTGTFPNPGETGKIYVALDTGAQWRWSGTAYVQLVASPGTTDNVPEGSANKYYTDVRVRAAAMTGLVNTAGTPAPTDSLLTVLGKLTRQAFGGFLLSVLQPVATTSLAIDGAANSTRNLFWFAAGAYAADISLQGDNATLRHNVTTNHQFLVSGNQKMLLNSAQLLVNAEIKSDTGNMTGIYRFADGTRYLQYNGTDYNFARGTGRVANDAFYADGQTSGYNIGYSHVRNGQVGYHMYNGGGQTEWVVYQPATATGHDFRIAMGAAGGLNDRLTIGTDGNTYVKGNLSVAQELWAGGNIVRFGGAASTKYIWFDGTNFQWNGAAVVLTGDFHSKDVYADRGDGSGVIWLGTNGGAGGPHYLYWDAANYNMPNGSLIVGGNITSSSDRRLKSDIRPLTGAREILAKIGSYRFTMADKPSVGVIAQEVEQVLPELVNVDSEGMLAVDYGKLAAVLIADNNALASRIAALEAIVERLAA